MAAQPSNGSLLLDNRLRLQASLSAVEFFSEFGPRIVDLDSKQHSSLGNL